MRRMDKKSRVASIDLCIDQLIRLLHSERPTGESTMNINGSTALVTGADRGLGARFVAELLAQGAAKIYVAARDPGSIDPAVAAHPRVRTLALDVTDQAS